MDGLLLESWGPFVTVDAWVSSNYFFPHFENTNVLINLCAHTVLETGDGPDLYEMNSRKYENNKRIVGRQVYKNRQS